MSEHEVSDPIKTPVRYNFNTQYIEEADGNEICAPLFSSLAEGTIDEVSLHIAKCINERPQLLAETLRLRQEVERLRAIQEHYSDSSNWACEHPSHDHEGACYYRLYRGGERHGYRFADRVAALGQEVDT